MWYLAEAGGTRRRLGRGLLGLGVIAGLVSGCGSSGSGSGSGSAKADDAAVKAGVAHAQQVVSGNMAAPTSIGKLPPLKTPPPRGKTIMYLDCGAPVCAIIGKGVEEAAGVVGWRYQRIVEGSEPDTINRAWNQAVQAKPAAVISVAVPNASFKGQLAKLKAEGVPYIAEAVMDPPGKDGLVAVLSSAVDEQQRGGWQADWIAADTKGSSHTVLFNAPSLPIFALLGREFTAEYKKVCPACSLDSVSVPFDSAGTTLPSRIVSYIQRHPDTDYIALGYADMALGVPQALRAAHLTTKVKIVSQGGTPSNFGNIVGGNFEVANVPTPEHTEGWYMLDAAIRSTEGMPMPQAVYDSPPRNFLTKANIKDPAQPYVAVPDYQAQFKKVWKLR